MDNFSINRFFISISFCTATFFAYSQENIESYAGHHCLYEKNSLTIGVSSPYSFELESFGLNARMYFNIGEAICFGPEYAYFKSKEIEIVDFDFVGHYIIETPWLGIYPLAGINYTIEKELAILETRTGMGLVFGAGLHRNFKSITTFIEYSRVEIGINDQFLTAGILYNFN